MEGKNINKKIYKLIALALSTAILSGCGNAAEGSNGTTGINAGESVSDSTDAADQTGSAATEISAENVQTVFTDMADPLLPDQAVQLSDGDMYVSSESNIRRFDNCDTSKENIIYEADPDVDIISFAVKGSCVYFILSSISGDKTVYSVEYADKDGNISELIKSDGSEDYAQADIYNNRLYLTGTDIHCVYELGDDGSIGDTVEDKDSLYSFIPDGCSVPQVSISGYSQSFYSPAWCMQNLGSIYYKDADNNLVYITPKEGADKSDGKALTENSAIPDMSSSTYYLGDGFAVTLEYTEEDNYSKDHFYYNDFKSGKKKEISTPNDSFLSFGSDCIYMGKSSETADNQTYVVSSVSFSDGSQKELFTLNGYEKTADYSVLDDLTKLGKELYYVRSVDYAENSCVRNISSPDQEFVFGSKMNDLGYSEAGMTLKHENCAVSIKDDDGKDKIFMTIEGSIPQFNGDTDSDMKLKEFFDDLWSDTKKDVIKQQLSYMYETDIDEDAGTDDTQDDESSDDAGTAASLAETVTYSDIPEDISYQYDMDSGWGVSSYIQTVTDIKYIDPSYICFGITGSDYQSGAAHGSYYNEYYLMDRSSGKRLKLSDVVNDTDDEIMSIVLKYFKKLEAESPDMYFEEAEDVVKGYKPDKLNFYVTNEGINIEFEIYEVTAYAYGTPKITIPYSEFDMKLPLKSSR